MSLSGVEAFSARLRRLRHTAGLTQEELAHSAGLSTNAVSQLERGLRRHPYPHTLGALADALDLDGAERAAFVARPASLDRSPGSGAPSTSPEVLPGGDTPLIGRDDEVTSLVSRLTGGSAGRLLTLTGPGGVGKSRLARDLAACARGAFADGVVFVPLASLTDPSLVVPTIVRAVGLREEAQTPPGELLSEYLRDKSLLLVLDNCEHLLAAAPRIAELLSVCPTLRILATSRSRLGVRGERACPVEPLAVPEAGAPHHLARISNAPAVRLFMARVQDADPEFALTPDNAEEIAEISRRLSGLPLALEVAAARVSFLGSTQLLTRLDGVLGLCGARDLPERQRTLRATLDWSHDLLSRAEQVLFHRLAVFAGGFDLEAAEAVSAGGELTSDVVLASLENLWEQALVRTAAAPGPAGMRYGMLEPVRQYALERLADSGEEDQVRARHADWCLTLAQRVEPELSGSDQSRWLDVLDAEHGNLRAALAETLRRTDDDAGLRLAVALRRFWYVRGHLQEGRRWLQEALTACSSAAPPLRGAALSALGHLAVKQGDFTAAQSSYTQALELATAPPSTRATAAATGGLAVVALWTGAHERATRLSRQSIALCRETGDPSGLATALNVAGLVEIQRGRHRDAAVLLEEGLAVSRAAGDEGLTAAHLNKLGWCHLEGEHLDQAARSFGDALTRFARLGEQWLAADCLDGLARVMLARGRPTRAARLWGAADAQCTVIGATTLPLDPSVYERLTSRARAEIGEDAFAAAWAQGAALSPDRVLGEALEEIAIEGAAENTPAAHGADRSPGARSRLPRDPGDALPAPRGGQIGQ
ncbi:Predicted ATPase [Geodermatophilus pulveris]|uniref:Predicted ATPase n=1 Tax=Geodermatophilus pulveris TaxID=1564159 RepID=A0A239E0Q8_9ACTN|nr:tetratricopeptide repeat protein [Geodermatophilus pulveris]SNS37961.1 Predicted ATPase [Geodermatophilus pulveris]